MRGERAHRLTQAAGVFDGAIARIAIAVGIRPNIDDRLSEICGWRRKGWIVVIVSVLNGDITAIEQFVRVRVVCRELLGIVRATKPPRESIVEPRSNSIQFFRHVAVGAVLGGK